MIKLQHLKRSVEATGEAWEIREGCVVNGGRGLLTYGRLASPIPSPGILGLAPEQKSFPPMQRGLFGVPGLGILPAGQPQIPLQLHVFGLPRRRRIALNHVDSWGSGRFVEDAVRVRRRGNPRKHASAARLRSALPSCSVSRINEDPRRLWRSMCSPGNHVPASERSETCTPRGIHDVSPDSFCMWRHPPDVPKRAVAWGVGKPFAKMELATDPCLNQQ